MPQSPVSSPTDRSRSLALRKKVDTNAVPDVQSLVNDLVLIFENAMLYNAKASDYHKMADTLRKQVHAQHEHYQRWKREPRPISRKGDPGCASMWKHGPPPCE